MIWLIEDSKRWGLFAGLVLVLALGWTWLSRVPASLAGGSQIPSPREGFLAPDFTLETLQGEAAALADYQGQVVILNLWASWCGPCRAEMPALQDVFTANRDRGLVVLGVNSTYQDNPAAARAFVEEFGLTFPILFDVDGAVSRRYLLRALPSTFFVDRKGVIRSVIVGGPMSEAVLQSKVETLLQEPP